MKPLRLEAEGFTCYRERQEPLDFSGLSLFAIAGPTGAGKSSILDAMLFALYGVVPRIGKQGIGEFIAHGRDAMAVTFDFCVQGSTYRVVRKVKRGARNLQAAATLAQLTAEGERSLADGVLAVNRKAEELLGLDFNAFTQTVVLPQGEFAKFLKADPKAQRAILQHLLRHEIYQRMREEAERRRTAIDRDLGGVERELRAYEHATPDALVERRGEVEAARVRLQQAAASKATTEAELAALRDRHERTLEVQRLRARRLSLDGRAAEVEARRVELAAAAAAAAIVPRLDALGHATAALERARAEHDGATAALRTRERARDAARAAADAATAAAADRADLLVRVRAIDEIKADLERRGSLTRRVQELERDRRAAERRATAAQAAFETARATHDAAGQARASAQAALDASGFDADAYRRVEAVWPTVVQVRGLEPELAHLDAAQERTAATLAAEEARAAAAGQALAVARDTRDAAEQRDAAAQAAVDAARADCQAAALRQHLHAGDPCPVCLQPVPMLPDAPAPPELAARERERADAASRLADARTAEQRAGEAHAAALAARAAAQSAHDAAVAARTTKLAAYAALLAQVVDAVADARAPGTTTAGTPDPRGEDGRSGAVLDAVAARRERLLAARQRHEEATARVREAEAALSASQLELVRAEADDRAAAGERARLLTETAAAQADLQDVTARIAAVTGDVDPSAERARLATAVAALDERLRTAQDALAGADAQVSAAAARLAAAEQSRVSAEGAVAEAQAALDAALVSAGFASAAAARAAVRDAAEQQRLDAGIREYAAEVTAVLRQLADLEPQVAGREVDAAAVAAAEAAAKAAFDAWRDADVALVSLLADCARLEQEVATCARLTAERDALRARLSVHAEMASDLKGDAFQEYLLEEAFHALVQGASVRLRQMSNRYTLEWQDGDFFVVDHDNAGERRRAETLSGGETFMASLCLALQLSDEVLKTSGALQMDSLFIDEGFGTLDGDALAEVTDAMEALREGGQRMIGVISHRPELTDRLPGCIRVVKGAGESTWTLARVG